MAPLLSFCGICVLLLTGKLLRSMFPLLQRLYFSSSVVGGLLGLAVLSLCRPLIDPVWYESWSKWPGFLINIVFAGLFLGEVTPRLRRIWHIAAPQVCYGQICAWGQYVFGLGLAGLVLMPLLGVPAVFGNLLEIGFEGGHGTVGGLIETFDRFDWAAGKDLGFTMATAGMILGIVVGMVLVNWAAARGYVRMIHSFDKLSKRERRGIYHPDQQPHAGRQTVFADSIDSLAFHIALIGLAILLGYCGRELLLWSNQFFPRAVADLHIFSGFPLFPLCMIGGLLVQIIFTRAKVDYLVDKGQMQRLAGAALDFLIVSAIATIRIEVVFAYWLPLLLLIIAGTVWNVFCVVWLAPRIFKEDWFERAIAEFGQSMGVTATELLLLRTVDPENKTTAPQAFGYKQLVHEPIMGGGLWTSLALVLVFSWSWFGVWLISVAVWLALIVCWLLFCRQTPPWRRR